MGLFALVPLEVLSEGNNEDEEEVPRAVAVDGRRDGAWLESAPLPPTCS